MTEIYHELTDEPTPRPTADSVKPEGGAELDRRLHCANCGSDYIHHFRVDVYSREAEDAGGVHAVVSDGSAEVDADMDGNPSRRRDGLATYFWCEQCDAVTRLALVQHKGHTYFETTEVERHD